MAGFAGQRFQALTHKLAEQAGVRNAPALAAAIGRKKYGKAAMAAKSAAGVRRKTLRDRMSTLSAHGAFRRPKVSPPTSRTYGAGAD